MRIKGKQSTRRTLAAQMSANFDDSLAEVAQSIDAMAAAVESPQNLPPQALDFLLDDIEHAIDSVLRERERTLSSR